MIMMMVGVKIVTFEQCVLLLLSCLWNASVMLGLGLGLKTKIFGLSLEGPILFCT